MTPEQQERATWRDLTWVEFLAWATGRTVVKTIDDYVHESGSTLLQFSDGSEAKVQSNYDGPYSDITPGNGIEPPTVHVRGDAAPRGPACGHSACSQHFIDTGAVDCILGGES